MRHGLALTLIAVVSLALAACASAPGGGEPATGQGDAIQRGLYTMRGNLDVSFDMGGRFQFDHEKEEWDDGYRVELEYMHFLHDSPGATPFVGAYLAFDDYGWEDGDAEIDFNAYTIGAEAGVIIWAYRQADLGIGVKPYARFGIGYETGSFDEVPTADGISEGDIQGMRLEGALGIDVEATFGERFFASLGFGAGLWTGADVTAETWSGGVKITEVDDLTFQGQDLFVRLGFGFLF